MMNYIIIMNTTTMATHVTLPVLKEMATTRDQLHWSKALPLSLQFNDGEIKLSTSSFLFKQSKLFQSFDIEEDNEIPILCSRSYVIDENNTCLFDDKPDLSFMFTLHPNKFLEVCKFLDIICYENEDTLFSKEFIIYVMTNIKEEINIIKYFMQSEIRSIMNYINNENADIQIKICTPTFYALYLTEYNEEVIKHNRINIFESERNKSKYYRYIHKYNNHTTFIVKETQEYNNYIERISIQLIDECKANNLNGIKKLIEYGANINYQNGNGNTALHFTLLYKNNIEIIKYFVEHGANINLQNNDGNSALHLATINYQNRYRITPLHYTLLYKNNIEIIQCLVEHGTNINLQNNDGNSALHLATYINNIVVIQYFVEHGANVNLQNKNGKTALSVALYFKYNEAINYLQSVMQK